MMSKLNKSIIIWNIFSRLVLIWLVNITLSVFYYALKMTHSYSTSIAAEGGGDTKIMDASQTGLQLKHLKTTYM